MTNKEFATSLEKQLITLSTLNTLSTLGTYNSKYSNNKPKYDQ